MGKACDREQTPLKQLAEARPVRRIRAPRDLLDRNVPGYDLITAIPDVKGT